MSPLGFSSFSTSVLENRCPSRRWFDSLHSRFNSGSGSTTTANIPFSSVSCLLMETTTDSPTNQSGKTLKVCKLKEYPNLLGHKRSFGIQLWTPAGPLCSKLLTWTERVRGQRLAVPSARHLTPSFPYTLTYILPPFLSAPAAWTPLTQNTCISVKEGNHIAFRAVKSGILWNNLKDCSIQNCFYDNVCIAFQGEIYSHHRLLTQTSAEATVFHVSDRTVLVFGAGEGAAQPLTSEVQRWPAGHGSLPSSLFAFAAPDARAWTCARGYDSRAKLLHHRTKEVSDPKPFPESRWGHLSMEEDYASKRLS